MSELKQSDGALDLPIIKVHVMMPGASSSRESTYASIKYSKTTTAEEVINHIRKKKQLPTDLRFELAYLPNTNITPSSFQNESIVLHGPAIISDIIFKVAAKDQGLWWLRESHEDSIARLVRRDTFNARKCSAEGLDALASLRAAIIAEDAEAEDATATLQDEDMAPALKEQAFVSRLIRQNSEQLHRAQSRVEAASAVSPGHAAAIAEDAEAEDATATLQDEDMAPALKEQAFVSRLIRQNSVQLHRAQSRVEAATSAISDLLPAFAEEDEQADEI